MSTTCKPQLATTLLQLEEKFDPERIYDFFSGFSDVVLYGHSSRERDNPYLPSEKPCYDLYRAGAKAGEGLLKELRKSRSVLPPRAKPPPLLHAARATADGKEQR